MKVTVKDCLQLDVFKQGVVVAGEGGLDHRVRTVSVMDDASLETAVRHCGKKDELVLTTFAGMRGQFAVQQEVVRQLARSGVAALAGLALIGLGCAPVYPSLIHAAPEYFGAARSQAVIGVQMAAAYTGTCLMPPAFGLLAEHAGTALLPLFLLLFTLLMAAMHESLLRRTEHGERCKIPGAQHGC